MEEEIVELSEDISSSTLYSEDLAPVPKDRRTWTKWSLAALWVSMAVCIPTYLLANEMIKSGMGWLESLIIIGLANLIITIPMVLNGHAGVKYGVPFPVIGRSSFGIKGIHLPSIARGLVACGWFGIQTWIGGLALYEIICVFIDVSSKDLNVIKFMCFGIFWFINMYFIWKGTDSIKWLEEFSAPILIIMGIALIGWGAYKSDGFGVVLDQSKQFQKPSATLIENDGRLNLTINPLLDKGGNPKAHFYQIQLLYKKGYNKIDTIRKSDWLNIEASTVNINEYANKNRLDSAFLEFRVKEFIRDKDVYSSWVQVDIKKKSLPKIWEYIKWLSIMLGFWATMSLSIADITRYSSSQSDQVKGQFMGLPGAMMLYSFVAIFVTYAAIINFDDILISDDSPWDPTAFLGKFNNPWMIIISQLFLIIATLSTNIAANVIAPSNAFSNLFPKKISFKIGGVITGIIGIIICPWWLMAEISNLMIFISGLLGPVLGIMLCDYFLIRKKRIDLAELYKEDGIYAYGKSGFNFNALIALIVGIVLALIWYCVESLEYLSSLAWFTGFFISFFLYYILMKKNAHNKFINNS